MRQVEFRMKDGQVHRAIVEDSMAIDLQEQWGQVRHNQHETAFQNQMKFPTGKELYERFRAINGWCAYRVTMEKKHSVTTQLFSR